jgi:hypothetical protein
LRAEVAAIRSRGQRQRRPAGGRRQNGRAISPFYRDLVPSWSDIRAAVHMQDDCASPRLAWLGGPNVRSLGQHHIGLISHRSLGSIGDTAFSTSAPPRSLLAVGCQMRRCWDSTKIRGCSFRFAVGLHQRRWQHLSSCEPLRISPRGRPGCLAGSRDVAKSVMVVFVATQIPMGASSRKVR